LRLKGVAQWLIAKAIKNATECKIANGPLVCVLQTSFFYRSYHFYRLDCDCVLLMYSF